MNLEIKLFANQFDDVYEVFKDGAKKDLDYWNTAKILNWCMAVTGTIRHILLFLVLLIVLYKGQNPKINRYIADLKEFLIINCNLSKEQVQLIVADCLEDRDILEKLKTISTDWQKFSTEKADEKAYKAFKDEPIEFSDEELDDLFKEDEYDEDDKMEESIEKHSELNQKIFNGMELKPEVRQKVQDITNEMLKILAEEEIILKVRDVILTGSNASYNYTKDSDIDVHILADTRELDDPQGLYPKLYNAYRRIFASKYDISFYDIPVEVYIELEDNPVVSNGIYSIMYDCWVKKPTETEIPEIDQKAIDEAAEPWKEEAKALIEEGSSDEIDDYIKRLYEMRQHGIHSEGGSEFSTENLIFKEVRNAGLLDELKELKNELIAQDLSLESLEEEAFDLNW